MSTWWSWTIWAVLLAVGGAASWTDITRRVIPNRLLLAGALAVLCVDAISGRILPSLEGGALLGVLGVVLWLTGSGAGDAKYLALVGLALGPVMGLAAWFLAALTAVLWHLPAVIRKGVKLAVAFGPFIAFGSVLAPFLVPVLLRMP